MPESSRALKQKMRTGVKRPKVQLYSNGTSMKPVHKKG